jgi:hypothetical protein
VGLVEGDAHAILKELPFKLNEGVSQGGGKREYGMRLPNFLTADERFVEWKRENDKSS